MSKYITVENFTKKRARKCMEEFEFMLDMCKCHGSPRSEIQDRDAESLLEIKVERRLP